MQAAELTGKARTHIVQQNNPRFAARPEVAEAFLALRKAAAQKGFVVHPVSSYRDFKTQLRIWNQKAVGERPLFDPKGNPLQIQGLSPDAIVKAILGWSALPGASRHHWGTEIDVVDLGAVSEDYTIQLLPQETEPGGPFHRMHLWLDDNMADFGFFRPYRSDRGGVHPEPWHLSYQPSSMRALEELTIETLKETIQASEMLLKDEVIGILPEIYQRYVLNIDPPD